MEIDTSTYVENYGLKKVLNTIKRLDEYIDLKEIETSGEKSKNYVGTIIDPELRNYVPDSEKRVFVKQITKVKSRYGVNLIAPFDSDDLMWVLNEARIYEIISSYENIDENVQLLQNNIVKYYGCYVSTNEHGKNKVYLVLEYIDPKKYSEITRDTYLKKNLQIEIVKTVQILHSIGIYHSDLMYKKNRSTNILVNEDESKFKIIDFGESCYSVDGQEEFGRFCFVEGRGVAHSYYPCHKEVSGDSKRSCLEFKDRKHLEGIGINNNLLLDMMSGESNKKAEQPVDVSATADEEPHAKRPKTKGGARRANRKKSKKMRKSHLY